MSHLQIFDEVHSLIQKDPSIGMNTLFEGLRSAKQNLPADAWEQTCESFPGHPLSSFIWQDPMTRRSFDKPRGYSGDAVLLDFIYGMLRPDQDVGVYSYAVSRPAASAVKERLEILKGYLQETRGTALSVASGHLREAEGLHNQELRITALDSDVESINHIARTLPSVKVIHAGVKSLLNDSLDLPQFELVYSAGLYDYLQDSLARALTAKLFQLVKPGGKLLLSNFLPTTPDRGYMECCMGWHLIYRDLSEIEALSSRIPEAQRFDCKVWGSKTQALGYLELTRRS